MGMAIQVRIALDGNQVSKKGFNSLWEWQYSAKVRREWELVKFQFPMGMAIRDLICTGISLTAKFQFPMGMAIQQAFVVAIIIAHKVLRCQLFATNLYHQKIRLIKL